MLKGKSLPHALLSHGTHIAHARDLYILLPTAFSIPHSTCVPRFRLEKEISLKRDESAITIRERLTNLAKEPMELMWGHHPTVGKPFLDSSCRIDTNGTVGFPWISPILRHSV